jgi:hypothetical protein
MGFLDSLLGNDAANASKAAAADTYRKQQDASSGLKTAGDQYATSFADLAKGYQPWQATGQVANDAVRNLIADPSSVRSLPGYQFGLDQGTHAIDHSALANGNLFSGKTGKALENWGVNYADKTYGDQLSRLLGVSQQGLGATQAGINTQGTGLTGQLGARTSAYGQDFNSAGTIGQGDIAAANAKAQGSQNLLNAGLQVAGMVAAPFTGGLSMAGSGALSRLFGGGQTMANPYNTMSRAGLDF